MKRAGIITVLLVVLQLCSGNIQARPTTRQEAEKAVIGWLKASPQPLGAALGQQVTKVQTYTDDGGNPLYYIVYLQPNGFIIVPADNLIEPIIGFVPEGFYDPSPDNPLGALVTRDLNGRVKLVRTTGQPIRTKFAIGASIEPQEKWDKFTVSAQVSGKDAGILGAPPQPAIDDVRVAPLVQTRWRQTTCCSNPVLACYNYYTPPYSAGDADNYPCGCVALALAQIMRYNHYPTSGIGTNSFSIKINGAFTTRSTLGGDGNGGAYNWDQMPLAPEPNCDITQQQRQAIGALCHDAGVGISNLVPDPNVNDYTDYGPLQAGGTSANTHSAKIGLVSTFQYSGAIWGYNSGSNIDINDLIKMINPNLDAGFPAYLGIRRWGYSDTGHAIVCDGYGYNVGTMYHHLNMGWAGYCDAWYNLPDINIPSSPYDTVDETIYNIIRSGSGEFISGRVTDPAGNPISDVNVHMMYYPPPSPLLTHHTNAKGIYAFYGLSSDSNIAVWADKTAYIFPGQMVVRTGKSQDSQPTSGNLWGVDIVCLAPEISDMSPTSGPGGTYMKIQGAHFGTLPGTVIFPGFGFFGEILQWSNTLILCRVPFCPFSGDVIVHSSVGVDSAGVHYDITSPTEIYVDVNHTPDVENGTTDYPFSTIERGIFPATYIGSTVVVKPGTYNENISLSNGSITLTSIDPNDPCIVASTIIDGGGGGNGPVVTFTNDCSVLTGFTITNGSANGYGGGIYCNGQCEELAPTISHCIITRNYSASVGGGIACHDSSPTISYCIITGNEAPAEAGGIYCENEEAWFSPTINHCLIVGNSSGVGGGVLAQGGSPAISNCDISGNHSIYGPGGIFCAVSNLMVHHTILWADTWSDEASYEAEIAVVGPSSVLTIGYSDVQGGLMGMLAMYGGSLHVDANTIINADPMFVRDPNPGPDGNWDDVNDDFGDLHLLEDSPCIDTGDPNFIPAPDTNTDMDGQPRIVGCRIDIGADEFIYLGDIEPDGDVDFADFAIFAGYWLDTDCGKCSGADLTGNDLAELTENWLKSLCQD
jgi:hypothetical protein